VTKLFSYKDASKYLEIPLITLKRWVVHRPDLPIEGTLVSSKARVFTQDELDAFKKYMDEHPDLRKRGRPADPDAPYHNWRDPATRRQPVNVQRVADGIKALVHRRGNPEKRKAALNAIGRFETLTYYPHVFKQYCPQFEVQEDGSVIFTGEGSIYSAVIDALAAYEQAVQG
jgi:hypothetical protein